MEEQLERQKEVLNYLLILEQEFRKHNEVHMEETEKQCVATERIWLLTQRYLIICNPPCATNSTFYPKPTESVILKEYNEKLKLLKSSNCRILQSVHNLRDHCKKFEQLHSMLDMQMETNFIMGDQFHKPISFFIELVNDLFKYFHAILLKIKYTAELMEPMDLSILEEYKKLIKPSEEFQEYLEMGLTYCRCLKDKPICTRVEKYPCLKKLPK